MEQMIVWRAIQGFIGGGMVPTVFASAYTIFPRSRMATITPLIGLVATLAPTIGPTVGGYLTDAFSWHWLFFINIVPGIIVTIAAITLIDFDQPNLSLFESFDWLGLISMASFLGTLEYVLEDGPRYDWFDDSTIALAAVVSASSAAIFLIRVIMARNPIVDLRAYLDRNFAAGSMFSFVLGIGLYGLTYLYPIYLGEIRGYNALMIGETMFVSGATMFFCAPMVGRLVDPHRPAHDAGRGLPDRRAEQLGDDLRHQGLGLLGAAAAADPARLRHDAGDRADHQCGARHADARPAEERLRPVQSDAQSRRRGRARGAQHRARRPHRPASRAPARVPSPGRASRRWRCCPIWRRGCRGSDAQNMALKQLYGCWCASRAS